MELSRTGAYDTPFPSLPHQLGFWLCLMKVNTLMKFSVLPNNQRIVCLYIRGHFAFKQYSLKKTSPLLTWPQGMLKLIKHITSTATKLNTEAPALKIAALTEIFLCPRAKWHFSSVHGTDSYPIPYWDVQMLPAWPSSKQLDKQEQHKDWRPDITQCHLESIKAISLC